MVKKVEIFIVESPPYTARRPGHSLSIHFYFSVFLSGQQLGYMRCCPSTRPRLLSRPRRRRRRRRQRPHLASFFNAMRRRRRKRMLQQKREEERERLLTFLRLPSATKQKKKGFSSSSSLFLTFLHICTQRREGEEGGGEGVSGMPCMRLPPPSYMCVCFLPSDVAERGKHADKRELHMCLTSSPSPSPPACTYALERGRREGENCNSPI